MVTCEKCKLILDDGTAKCPRCGEGLAAAGNGRRAADIHAMLASANLHRIRGEWDDAIELCMEVLKLEPKSAEAYEMLGDIYESRGQDEDAMQWFSMALDLAPASTTIRVKLDRLREKVARLEAARQPPPIGEYGSWSDRLAGRGFDSAIRLVTVISVVLIVLLVAAGLIAFLWRSPSDEAALKEAEKPLVQEETRPPAAPNGGSSTNAGQQAAGTLPRLPSEQQLLTAISTDPSIIGRSVLVDDVRVDPRANLIIVTFRVSGVGGQLTKAMITTDAAAVAKAAFSASPGIEWVMLRCCGSVADGPGAQTQDLLFVSEVKRAAIAPITPETAPEQIQQVFTNPWWHQKLK